MAYYSFELHADHPVAIPDPFLLLETGLNVVSAVVSDMAALRKTFLEEGVTIKKVFVLDDLDSENVQLQLSGNHYEASYPTISGDSASRGGTDQEGG